MNNKNLFVFGTSIDLVSRVVFIVTGFLINIIFARYYGAESYGDLAILLSVLTILNMFLTNGVPNSLSRFIASPENSRNEIWRKAFTVQSITVIIITAIAFLTIDLICRYMNVLYLKTSFYFLLIILPLNALYYLHIGVLNGLRDFKNQAIVNIIYPIIRLVSSLILILSFDFGVVGVILGTAIAYLPSIFYASKKWEKQIEGKSILTSELITFSIKVMGLFLLITLLLNVDLIVLKSLTSNKKDIGVYSAMMSIGKIAYFVLYSFSSTIFPIVSNLKSMNKHDEISNLLNKVFRGYLNFGTLIFVVSLFFAAPLLKILYGVEYTSGEKYLPWYTLGIIQLSFVSLITNVLFVTYHGRRFLVILLLMIIVEVVGIYYLYEKFYLMSGPVMFTTSTFVMIAFLMAIMKSNKISSVSFKSTLMTILFVALSLLLKYYFTDNIASLFVQHFIHFIFIVFLLVILLKMNSDLLTIKRLSR